MQLRNGNDAWKPTAFKRVNDIKEDEYSRQETKREDGPRGAAAGSGQGGGPPEARQRSTEGAI